MWGAGHQSWPGSENQPGGCCSARHRLGAGDPALRPAFLRGGGKIKCFPFLGSPVVFWGRHPQGGGGTGAEEELGDPPHVCPLGEGGSKMGRPRCGVGAEPPHRSPRDPPVPSSSPKKPPSDPQFPRGPPQDALNPFSTLKPNRGLFQQRGWGAPRFVGPPSLMGGGTNPPAPTPQKGPCGFLPTGRCSGSCDII